MVRSASRTPIVLSFMLTLLATGALAESAQVSITPWLKTQPVPLPLAILDEETGVEPIPLALDSPPLGVDDLWPAPGDEALLAPAAGVEFKAEQALDFAPLPADGSDAVHLAYAVTYLDNPAWQKGKLEVTGRAPFRLFLDGEKVCDRTAAAAADTDQVSGEVTLDQGWRRLVLVTVASGADNLPGWSLDVHWTPGDSTPGDWKPTVKTDPRHPFDFPDYWSQESVSNAAVTRDGRYLAVRVSGWQGDQGDRTSRLEVWDLVERSQVWNFHGARVQDFTWDAAGQRLLLQVGADKGSDLFFWHRSNGLLERIDTGIEHAGSFTWAPDGSGLYLNAAMRGHENVLFVPVDGGEPRAVTEGAHMLGFSTMDAEGAFMVGVRETSHRPGDVVRIDLDSGEPTYLTAVNQDVLTGVRLGEVEEIWYPSVDDFEVQGWIIKPPDFDPERDYPMMLVIHGGPHGMYDVGFNFSWQNHAANDYVVLYTNPRGSSGYGSAFGNAIENAYPGKDYDDLMNGVDEVLSRGYVDEENMFVYGCSGGGVLTSWVVGQTDRFRAASANCPVTNWLSFVGTTDSPYWYSNFDALPWDDPTEHLARSPLMHVGNVSTPTMLMTGVQDLRTPMPQTEEYYQALKYLKVPTVMVRFNDEWHGTSSNPSNFLRTQMYLRGWFERWGDHDDGRPVTQDR